MGNNTRTSGIKISLVFYDLVIFVCVDVLLLKIYKGVGFLTDATIFEQSTVACICIMGCRFIFKIYKQIWRYGGIESYIRFLISDGTAYVLYALIQKYLLPTSISVISALALCSINCLLALAMRMSYRYAYKCGTRDDYMGLTLRRLLKVFSLGQVETEKDPDNQKIKVAILGAGSVGVGLAEDLLTNPKASYVPRCYIDNDPAKIGRSIQGIGVTGENNATIEELKKHHIQEIIFAVPNMDADHKMKLYDYYQSAGFRVKVFDYPSMDAPGKRRQLREFDIEDLLMRQPKEIINDKTRTYYEGRTILITGGGGSIGSEMCRQLAKLSPKQLVVLDSYENCAYELQQELKFQYGRTLDVKVEIISITNLRALERVFDKYKPDICINAAAHKHVPFMEDNCVEAIENNVFGTLNVLNCCKKYDCGRFLMVSTDKAVNPTNVMGATKRVCERIVQAYGKKYSIVCSATRFGNVLGSAGSVIPLFRKQIASGGPVTVTDKRIIRYFMTIPEASQLVLTSGAMASNGELFVLDMGKPVKIYDLAKNMISLSGMNDIEIIETGLRPGEKLYEELLMSSSNLDKTDNELIYIEQETPATMEEVDEALAILRKACDDGDEDGAREALRRVVPTYRRPEDVNQEAKEKIKGLC